MKYKTFCKENIFRIVRISFKNPEIKTSKIPENHTPKKPWKSNLQKPENQTLKISENYIQKTQKITPETE